MMTMAASPLTEKEMRAASFWGRCWPNISGVWGSIMATRTAFPHRRPTIKTPWSWRARVPNSGQEASAKMRL